MKALRILVVEDDVMIGGLLAETLEDLGYVVCAVGCGDNGDYAFTPFGHLAEGNPFETYRPPE